MQDFNDLWTKCHDLYRALRKKGTLVLSGRTGDYEISYVHYDDFVALVEGYPTPEAACAALLQKLCGERDQRVAALQAAHQAELAALEAP